MLHFQANEGFLPELKKLQFQNRYEVNRIKKSWVPSRYFDEKWHKTYKKPLTLIHGIFVRQVIRADILTFLACEFGEYHLKQLMHWDLSLQSEISLPSLRWRWPWKQSHLSIQFPQIFLSTATVTAFCHFSTRKQKKLIPAWPGISIHKLDMEKEEFSPRVENRWQAEVGKGLWRRPCPTSAQSRATYRGLHSAVSSQMLSISKDQDSTLLLGFIESKREGVVCFTKCILKMREKFLTRPWTSTEGYGSEKSLQAGASKLLPCLGHTEQRGIVCGQWLLQSDDFLSGCELGCPAGMSWHHDGMGCRLDMQVRCARVHRDNILLLGSGRILSS